MKHYSHLTSSQEDKIFYIKPKDFSKDSSKELIADALGATLYTPLTDVKIAQRIIESKNKSLTCNVWCLEDAISDCDVEFAEKNLFKQLELLEKAVDNHELQEKNIPIIFVRVRSVEQLKKILENPNKLKMITGFNLPKFCSLNGDDFLTTIDDVNKRSGFKYYAMPILESESIIYKELRMQELIKIKNIIKKHEDIVLNVRIGGTDFSSLYGIRRGVDFTIYDISVIRDCISDIINMFSRAEDNFVVSGAVWEYFPEQTRMLKPQLRETPFLVQRGEQGRKERVGIISKEIDGLIKEVILDKANGLSGKTIIHPSHITFVNAFQSVTYEEYQDAKKIIESQNKGVFKSCNGNKMNEVKPHYNWARKIIRKSEIYGVLNKNSGYVQLF